MSEPWRDDLLDQLDFYWSAHLRPRLEGLEDAEFWWEPASGAWSLRSDDDGVLRLEQLSPEPPTPPLTTIAWRIVHVARDVMGARARALFGPTSAPDDADMFDPRHWPDPLPSDASDALALLDAGYQAWRAGVARLSDAELRAPIGPRGGPFADDSMSRLVLHINREVMAHGAEICLLRDLYRARRDREDPLVRAVLEGDVEGARRLLGTARGGEHLAASRGEHPDVAQNDVAQIDVARVERERPGLVAEAAGLGHWVIVRELVEAGFHPDGGSGWAGRRPTALHFAARGGSE